VWWTFHGGPPGYYPASVVNSAAAVPPPADPAIYGAFAQVRGRSPASTRSRKTRAAGIRSAGRGTQHSTRGEEENPEKRAGRFWQQQAAHIV
jgi:hypothetical protein